MFKYFSGKKNETFIQKDIPKINVLQQKMEVKKMSKLVFQLQTPMDNTSTFRASQWTFRNIKQTLSSVSKFHYSHIKKLLASLSYIHGEENQN